MSDPNLMYDKYFQERIAENADGWLAVDLFLSCRRIKMMKVTAEEVMEACRESGELDVSEQGIRRKDNKPLP